MSDDRMSYAQFGARFFEHAVTAERIRDGFGGVAGEPIAFGPKGVGPGRLAKVTARGEVGAPDVEPLWEGDDVAFTLTIPVHLALTIDLGLDRHAFDVTLAVRLALTARAAPPLRVVIDVEPPRREHVSAVVEAAGLRAAVLQRVAGVDDEIRRFVARYIAREIDKPHIRAARDIDVAARIDGAWRPA